MTQKERREKILEIAQSSPSLRDGELELDSSAKISEGDDNGAYIQTCMGTISSVRNPWHLSIEPAPVPRFDGWSCEAGWYVKLGWFRFFIARGV